LIRERISYRDLQEFFFQIHRAHPGEGLVGPATARRLSCASEEQRKVAEDTIRDVDASGHWPGRS
jgi:peptide-methionine (S)-S-oxide reductase